MVKTVRTLFIMIITVITIIKIITGVRTGIAIQRVPPELKHLSKVRKRNTIEIPQVAASENGRA